ncbi:MAG TPA: pilus assembly protein N-terminal domain-containing protein, partial [Paracoccaceae bacterium]|nr:pilus assembly protein N-terminal domain-containing protein [Paracoccaceae bacterium]
MPASAQRESVLSIARGLQSGEITVLIDQAAVLESEVEFAEVSIANPAIADVQPVSNETIYIFGQARGTTSLTLFGENGQLITNVIVNVVPDISQLKERLRQLLPGEPIEVRTAADGIVLSGTVSGAAKVDRAMSLARAYGGDAVINMLSVGGTQQVMLKVKVAEISRNAGKDIGVSLGLLGTTGDVSPILDTGSSIRITEDEDTGATILENLSPALGTFSGAFGAIFNIADSLLLDV